MNCLFCSRPGQSRLSKEHLLSNPICSTFALDRKTTQLGRFDAVSGQEPTVASLEATSVRAVCAACNSGWMGTLENDAARVFADWTAGASLDADEAAVVRRWIAKTHLILCALEGGIRQVLDDPSRNIIPDVTLAKAVAAATEDGYGNTRLGAARNAGKPRLIYAFGTPDIRAARAERVGRAVGSASVVMLGPLQLWTVNTTLPFAGEDGIRLPKFVAPIVAGSLVRRLRTGPKCPDVANASVDFSPWNKEQM